MNSKILLLAGRWSLSILLVYFIILGLHLPAGFLALVSIAGVIQLSPEATFERSILRIIGVLIGGVLIFSLLSFGLGHPIVLIIGCLVITGIAGHLMLTPSIINYAGVMIAITMIIVIAFTPFSSTNFFIALPEAGMILLGAVGAMIAEGIFSLFTREHFFTWVGIKNIWMAFQPLIKLQRNENYCFRWLQLFVAVSITLIPWFIFQYRDGFWAITSCFFVLEESLAATKIKSRNRFLAHLCACIIGAMIVFVSYYYPLACFPLFLCGIFAICIFMIKQEKLCLMGNTMGIALTIMVMGGDNAFIFYRFIYTTVGIIVGLVVCELFSKFYARKAYVRNTISH